jgi:type I restriction enzyme S subunit
MTIKYSKLKDCCEIKPPKSEAKKLLNDADLVSFVPMANLGINTKDLSLNEDKALSDVTGSYTYFAENDVLLAKITPCFENGKLGIAKGLTNEVGFGSSEFIVFRVSEELIPEYLYYFLLRPVFREHGQKVMTGAVGHKRVPKDYIENSEIRLPPISEQKRIVALLDTVFSALEQTRAKTEQNLKNARELFDSYLQQVFSQKGEDWVETTLGEITGGVSTGPFGSLLHKSDYIENGIPLVNPAHIVGQNVVPDTSKTISEKTALRLSAYKMKVGDIVIGRRGEMGRCALITQTEDGYLCGTGSFIIKSSDRCDGGFLVRFLRSASCVASLEKIAGGAVMPNLSNSSLSKFGIRVPSKNKQIEITKFIDQLSIEIEKVVDIYNEKLKSIDELKKSILQKAFSGELTTTAK